MVVNKVTLRIKPDSRVIIALLLSLSISGCISERGIHSDQDYGPQNAIDVSHVQDAVPKVEPRTRAGNPGVYSVLGRQYRVLDTHVGYSEEGIASWYGYKFHGRKTANGETYDMFAMTAAHKTLPIPSYVRVTNLDNQREIMVRINDRGPFHDGRIIDLSYAGASKLGIVDAGTGRVKVEAIDVSQAARNGTKDIRVVELPENVFLQVGAFSSITSASALQSRLQNHLNYPVKVGPVSDGLHKVRIGPIDDALSLEILQERIAELKINGSYLVKEP